jgi:hypothetical protein
MSNESKNSFVKNFGIGAVSIAAGALVAVVAIRSGAEIPGADPASLAGTMVTRGGQVVGQDIAQLALDGNDVIGQVAFVEREGTIQAEFNINSPEPIEVRLELPDADVAFGGVAQVAGKPLPPAMVQAGSISMMSNGERHFAVFINRESSDAKRVKVSFVKGGNVVREEMIDLPAKTSRG